MLEALGVCASGTVERPHGAHAQASRRLTQPRSAARSVRVAIAATTSPVTAASLFAEKVFLELVDRLLRLEPLAVLVAASAL